LKNLRDIRGEELSKYNINFYNFITIRQRPGFSVENFNIDIKKIAKVFL